MSEATDDIREHLAYWQRAIRALQPGTWQHVRAKRHIDYYEAALSAASYAIYQRETLSDAELQGIQTAVATREAMDAEPEETPEMRDAEIAHYAQVMGVVRGG